VLALLFLLPVIVIIAGIDIFVFRFLGDTPPHAAATALESEPAAAEVSTSKHRKT